MITRAGLADEIDGLELQIKALNEMKSAAYKAYRDQLEDAGMEPRRASAEVSATKAAIAKRRRLRENPAEAREKDELIDAILVEIMERPSRAREADIDPKLVETIVKGVQTEIGRKALVTALDIMIDSETGEVIEDQPEADTEFHPPVTSREAHKGDPSPTLGERDLAEVGTGQKRAVLPQEPYTATNHQSVSPSSPDGSASTESAADAISEPAQPSHEPVTAGEGGSLLPLSSPAPHSDDAVPAFLKQDKPGCLKLRDGHCKIGFATEALCAECAHKRAREAA
ncbi:MAG: hypothetical protein H6877_09885 [Rhodobiaceae bacterium]|nr:hypothetical protein [Rhodobiaceae bacterium]